MAEILNTQQLPDFVRLPVVRFVERLIDLHGENVVSVAVYGSIASGNFIPKISDVNIAVVVTNLKFSVLKSSLRLVKEGIAHKINAPLFLTEEYISRSLDVFPIEFLDIKDHHILLYGKDTFKDLNVDTAYLRIFCEQQIKGKLLRIRQAYLETGLNGQGKIKLLHDSLSALIPIFRNILRLRNKSVPSAKLDVLRSMENEFGIKDSVFVSIYNDRSSRQKINEQSADDHLDQFIQQLEKLVLIVDHDR